jgi:hypothetical protein
MLLASKSENETEDKQSNGLLSFAIKNRNNNNNIENFHQ